ncbi:hypothetical protein V6N13_036336 [Hibiscus sabdariffa]|uniref:Uncharacterized protein n=1 Tax=Hibiscus sabdariffa TaxID=183260 RepID=A0ABR2S6X3_9ROSI
MKQAAAEEEDVSHIIYPSGNTRTAARQFNLASADTSPRGISSAGVLVFLQGILPGKMNGAALLHEEPSKVVFAVEDAIPCNIG